MKNNQELDKLTGAESRIAKTRRHLLAKAPKTAKNYFDLDASGPKERREKVVNKSRRGFLDMISKAGISSGLIKASPLLAGALSSRYAHAQVGGKKRVVFCYVDSGCRPGSFLPSSVSQMNSVTEPYSDVASICNFRQVDVLVHGHSMMVQALGETDQFGPRQRTMDLRIAEVLGASTPYSAVYLGSQANGSARGLVSNLGPCEDNPQQAFSNLFSGATPSPTQAVDTTYQDALGSQMQAIEKIRSRLGSDENNRLQQHYDALVRMRNNMDAQLEGSAPDVGQCGSSVPALDSSNFQATGKTQADIIIAALQCGLTNVATLQLGHEDAQWHAHSETSTEGRHAHDIFHSREFHPRGAWDDVIRYAYEIPAYFIRRLMTERDADGDVLIDNTVFVQVTCMGNSDTHDPQNAPFIVATRMPGFNNSFSTLSRGTTQDLNGAIPKGLGIDGLLTGMGSDNLGLLS